MDNLLTTLWMTEINPIIHSIDHIGEINFKRHYINKFSIYQ